MHEKTNLTKEIIMYNFAKCIRWERTAISIDNYEHAEKFSIFKEILSDMLNNAKINNKNIDNGTEQ